MRRDPHWIDGKPAEPANGQWLDVFDPATREVAFQVADGDARDVDAAVQAAQAAFPAWSGLPNSARARWLETLADALETPFPELPPRPDAAPAAATSPSPDSLGELP